MRSRSVTSRMASTRTGRSPTRPCFAWISARKREPSLRTPVMTYVALVAVGDALEHRRQVLGCDAPRGRRGPEHLLARVADHLADAVVDVDHVAVDVDHDALERRRQEHGEALAQAILLFGRAVGHGRMLHRRT